MKQKFFQRLVIFGALLVISFIAHPQNSVAADVELVIGSGDIKGDLFAAGNAISIASALNGKGFKVYNYGTKGGKDNIKRVTKKKKSINFGMVTAKDLSKAKAKQIKKLRGLMSLGTLKGKQILLIVRNKAPKKVSKDSYKAVISSVVKLLNSSKSKERIKSVWAGYGPKRAPDAFKNVGVKLHPSAMK